MNAAGATAAGRPRSAGGTVREALARVPRLRRRIVAVAALALALLCGYLFWLRESSLVKVQTVTVTGLTSHDAGRVKAALAAAATQMTTLHVDHGRLEEATTAFPVVRSIDVRPDFPHGMRIHVVEHRPAALLVSGSKRVPVAADGSVLRGLPVTGKLPLVRLGRALPERRMTGGAAFSAVRVAGGLPAALAARVHDIRRDPGKGVIVPIEDGPRLIFGSSGRVKAKWAAAVRVLADPDAAGADYIDVRIPERPVAGGLPVATVAPAPLADEASSPAPVAPGEDAATAPSQGGAVPNGIGQAPPRAAPVPGPRVAPPPQTDGGGAAAPDTQP